jgi:hypothetical protein
LSALLLIDKPWFLKLRKNLAAVFITPSSWGSQRAGLSTRHQLFFGAIIPAISGVRDIDLPDMLGQSRAATAQGILKGHHYQILWCGYRQ